MTAILSRGGRWPALGWIIGSFGSAGGWARLAVAVHVGGGASLLVGVMVLFYLDDSIQSRWLDADQKAMHRPISVTMAPASWISPSARPFQWQGLDHVRDLLRFAMGNYRISFWLPSLIKPPGSKACSRWAALGHSPAARGGIDGAVRPQRRPPAAGAPLASGRGHGGGGRRTEPECDLR
jgi:hypothetical protein